VERTEIEQDGNHYSVYEACVEKIELELDNGEFDLRVSRGDEMSPRRPGRALALVLVAALVATAGCSAIVPSDDSPDGEALVEEMVDRYGEFQDLHVTQTRVVEVGDESHESMYYRLSGPVETEELVTVAESVECE
jgi:hypothetical protein